MVTKQDFLKGQVRTKGQLQRLFYDRFGISMRKTAALADALEVLSDTEKFTILAGTDTEITLHNVRRWIDFFAQAKDKGNHYYLVDALFWNEFLAIPARMSFALSVLTGLNFSECTFLLYECASYSVKHQKSMSFDTLVDYLESTDDTDMRTHSLFMPLLSKADAPVVSV